MTIFRAPIGNSPFRGAFNPHPAIPPAPAAAQPSNATADTDPAPALSSPSPHRPSLRPHQPSPPLPPIATPTSSALQTFHPAPSIGCGQTGWPVEPWPCSPGIPAQEKPGSPWP